MHFRSVVACKRKACLYWLTFLKDISKEFTCIFFLTFTHSLAYFFSVSFSFSFLPSPPTWLGLPESYPFKVQSTTFCISAIAIIFMTFISGFLLLVDSIWIKLKWMNEQEMNQQPNPFYLLIDRQIDAISDPSPLYRCSKGLWVETTHIVKEKNKVKDEVNENAGKKKSILLHQ